MVAVMFRRESLQFLPDLEANNTRDWFQPRKEQYEQLLKDPLTRLVEAINRELPNSAADYITNPQKAVYRIYRDTRFSKNKTPYKTHVSALLWHSKLGKDGGAGLYFHLSPKEFLVAGGLYKSPPEILTPVRQHISEEHARLRKVLRAKATRECFG